MNTMPISSFTQEFTLGQAHDIARMDPSVAHLNPTLGQVGFLFSIVLSLFNSGRKYDKEFRVINDKLEKFGMQLDELSNLMPNGTATDIKDSSSDIYRQMTTLMNYVQPNTSNLSLKYIKREEFIREYELFKKDSHVQTLNRQLQSILNDVAKTSNYNKKNVTNVGQILMDSMMMGISCSYSYEFLKNHGNYTNVLIRWRSEIYKLNKMIADHEKKCVQMAPISAKIDIERSLSHYDTSNQQEFTRNLYQHLTSTYDWLSWMVIVYDRDVQSSLNVFKSNGGIHVKGKKNVVAFYYNNRQKPITSFNAVNNALGRVFQPRVIASSLYYFLRDYGVTGEIFVCRVIYGITAQYDKSYGMATTSGRLFVAKFGY